MAMLMRYIQQLARAKRLLVEVDRCEVYGVSTHYSVGLLVTGYASGTGGLR